MSKDQDLAAVAQRTRRAFGAAVCDQIGEGNWEVTAMLDAEAVRPMTPASAFDELRDKVARAIQGGRPHVVIVCEVRPTREQLEHSILELRDALERNAEPENGWKDVADADAFEASRELVPDRETADQAPPDPPTAEETAFVGGERSTQADYYPRSRYGSKL